MARFIERISLGIAEGEGNPSSGKAGASRVPVMLPFADVNCLDIEASMLEKIQHDDFTARYLTPV